MKCKDFKALLQDYIDDNLSYGEKQEMDEHIRDCKSCAEIYKNELYVDSKLSDIFGEKHITGDDFTQNVLSQINQNYYKGVFSNMKFRIKKHAALYAFACALVVCILAAIPYVKSPAFKNFTASLKNHQTNIEQPKPAENNNNTKLKDDNSKTNTDTTNNAKNTPSNDNAFRILIQDSQNSNTIYVYEPLTNKKVTALDSKIISGNHDNSMFVLVGDRIYFYNSTDKLIKYMTFDGKVTSLSFMKPYSNGCTDFIVSADNKKIAWNTSSTDSNGLSTYKVYTADIDGKNIKKLYTKSYTMRALAFMKWSSDNSGIYLGQSFSGIGGKANTEKLEDLYKVSYDTGKEILLMKQIRTGGDYDNSEYISAMSNDDNLVAYFKNKHIFIKNLNTSQEQSYPIPINDYLSVGNSQFSPDGKYIVYHVNVDNNDSYITKYVLLNLSTGQSQIIK